MKALQTFVNEVPEDTLRSSHIKDLLFGSICDTKYVSAVFHWVDSLYDERTRVRDRVAIDVWLICSVPCFFTDLVKETPEANLGRADTMGFESFPLIAHACPQLFSCGAMDNAVDF